MAGPLIWAPVLFVGAPACPPNSLSHLHDVKKQTRVTLRAPGPCIQSGLTGRDVSTASSFSLSLICRLPRHLHPEWKELPPHNHLPPCLPLRLRTSSPLAHVFCTFAYERPIYSPRSCSNTISSTKLSHIPTQGLCLPPLSSHNMMFLLNRPAYSNL